MQDGKRETVPPKAGANGKRETANGKRETANGKRKTQWPIPNT